MTLDRDLLIKLLNMTTSDHEGEVLSAIQKSNELLRRSRTNWSDIIKPAEAPAARPQAQPQPQGKAHTQGPGRSQVPPERPREAEAAARRTHWAHERTGGAGGGPGTARSHAHAQAHGHAHFSRYREHARPNGLISAIRSMPWPLRIPLFPVWLAAELFAGDSPIAQTRARRGAAMLVVVVLYVLCFGLSIAVINEAFGY